MIQALGVAIIYMNCFLISFAYGIVSGFDTLGSNAFGAKKYKLFGYFYQRGLLISSLSCIVLLIFHFFFAMKVIKIFNLKEEVFEYCENYLLRAMNFIFFDVLFNMNFRYITIVGKAYVNIIILFSTMVLHVLFCYLYIVRFDLGVEGGAYALLSTQFLNSFLGFLYIVCMSPFPSSVFCLNKSSFKEWSKYLKVAIPGTLLACVEYWSWEILSIVAIWISDDVYSAYIITGNISQMVYSVTRGFYTSCTVLCGIYISSDKIGMIKQTLKVASAFSFSIMFVLCTASFFLKRSIINLYIDKEPINSLADDSFIYLCIAMIIESISLCLSGALIGIGKLCTTTAVTLSVYVVSLNGFSIVFGKVLSMEVSGIWLGYLISCSMATLIYFFIFKNLDFNKVYQETLKRTESPIDEYNKLEEEQEESLDVSAKVETKI